MLIIFDLDDTLYDKTGQVKEETKWDDARKITLFPGANDFLRSGKGKLVLVTKESDKGLQEIKINALGIRHYFADVFICHSNEDKKVLFGEIKNKYPEEEIWAVGDRLDTDICFAKEMGFTTVQMVHGKYKDMVPEDALSIPDYKITTFLELEKIIPQKYPQNICQKGHSMKAVILAAGKGVRLLPLTADKPKVLMEIDGKPFLWYVLENLKKAGVTEYGIVVSYKKEKIQEFCEAYKIKATLIEQREPTGTGDAVKQARNFCREEDFIIVSGDNLYSVDDLQAVQRNDTSCYITGKEVEHWQKYGVLVVEKDTLVKIVEKPKEFVGNLVNVGLYKCTKDIWQALDAIGLSARGEYEFTDALSLLAQEGKVKVLQLQKYWLDLGCKDDIKKIEEFLRKLPE